MIHLAETHNQKQNGFCLQPTLVTKLKHDVMRQTKWPLGCQDAPVCCWCCLVSIGAGERTQTTKQSIVCFVSGPLEKLNGNINCVPGVSKWNHNNQLVAAAAAAGAAALPPVGGNGRRYLSGKSVAKLGAKQRKQKSRVDHVCCHYRHFALIYRKQQRRRRQCWPF